LMLTSMNWRQTLFQLPAKSFWQGRSNISRGLKRIFTQGLLIN
jgi:hypothetical protein